MTKEVPPPMQLDAFLPKDGSNGETEYKVTKSGNDEEANAAGKFDALKKKFLRRLSQAGCIGVFKSFSTILILFASETFRNSGLGLGIHLEIIVSLSYKCYTYISVVCAHEQYRRSGKTAMSFADVASEACIRGPKWSKRFAPYVGQILLIGTFITYLGIFGANVVILATIFTKVLADYLGYEISVRFFIPISVLLLSLGSKLNLKNLTRVSKIADICMVLLLSITCCQLLTLPPTSSIDRRLAFHMFILTMEANCILFMETNMEKPTDFMEICGVLNQGVSDVTLGYFLIGVMDYIKFRNAQKNFPPQVINILFALAFLCNFVNKFYVCQEIVSNGVQEKFTSRPLLSNRTIKIVMGVILALIAIPFPTIMLFVGYILNSYFAILINLFLVFIYVSTFRDQGFGKFYWKIWVIVFLIVLAGYAFIFLLKLFDEDYRKAVDNGTSVFNVTAEIVNGMYNGAFNSTISL